MADFTWKGFDWNRRDADGSDSTNDPMYNGKYKGTNVSDPDGNDYVTLSISKPSGVLWGAEMFTELDNFGYGTYMVVVGSRLDTLQKAVVFGGLFLYSDSNTGNAAISNNEIDINETSAWGESENDVATSHNYFWNNSGVIDATDDPYITTTDAVTTHVMEWTPGKLEFWSYAGTGTGGTLLKHTVYTVNVPDPAESHSFMDINLWVFGDGSVSPGTTTATSVVVRDVSYTPYSEPVTTSKRGSFFFE